ncbi:unnamed protein product [Candida verbasci]|uniref:Uncharacterized protein n=1 Tax=Candida verbasci TaxID=1227364 RepID=A0A9W4U1U9_9ASCO|nr:unnamed protein product [Candida verbasci]
MNSVISYNALSTVPTIEQVVQSRNNKIKNTYDIPVLIFDFKLFSISGSIIFSDLNEIKTYTVLRANQLPPSMKKNHSLKDTLLPLTKLLSCSLNPSQYKKMLQNVKIPPIGLLIGRINFDLRAKNNRFLDGLLNEIKIINKENVDSVIAGIESQFTLLLKRLKVEASSEIYNHVIEAYDLLRFEEKEESWETKFERLREEAPDEFDKQMRIYTQKRMNEDTSHENDQVMKKPKNGLQNESSKKDGQICKKENNESSQDSKKTKTESPDQSINTSIESSNVLSQDKLHQKSSSPQDQEETQILYAGNLYNSQLMSQLITIEKITIPELIHLSTFNVMDRVFMIRVSISSMIPNIPVDIIKNQIHLMPFKITVLDEFKNKLEVKLEYHDHLLQFFQIPNCKSSNFSPLRSKLDSSISNRSKLKSLKIRYYKDYWQLLSLLDDIA